MMQKTFGFTHRPRSPTRLDVPYFMRNWPLAGGSIAFVAII